MRLSLAAIVGTLLALAIVLSACGDDRTKTGDNPAGPLGGMRPARDAGETTSAAATAERSRSADEVTHPRGVCRAQLHGFIGSLDVLRDKLARGLSYNQYLHEVQVLRAGYDKIDAEKLPLGCLFSSGTPAERAYDLYIDAVNAWGNCLATVSCDTASIEPKLQRKWALASAQLSTAQRGLS